MLGLFHRTIEFRPGRDFRARSSNTLILIYQEEIEAGSPAHSHTGTSSRGRICPWYNVSAFSTSCHLLAMTSVSYLENYKLYF